MTRPTTCLRGHDLNDESNIYRYKNKRICKQCRKDRAKQGAITKSPNPAVAGMTKKEKKTYYARLAYWKDKGKPVPAEKGKHFRPGADCEACHLPIATRDDKHSNYATHRWCRPGDAFRDGELCKICELPVSITAKHCKEKAHDACVKKRSEANKKAKQEDRNARRPKPKPEQFQKLQRMSRVEKSEVVHVEVLDTPEERARVAELLERARVARMATPVLSRWERDSLWS